MDIKDIKVKDFIDIVYYQTEITLKDYYNGEIIEKNVTPRTWNERLCIYDDYYVYSVGEGLDGFEIQIGK